ncbi:hypothetical protein ACNR90_003381 [Candidozyma auris]
MTPAQKSTSVYLVHRFAFLEKIILKSFRQLEEAEAEGLVKLLQVDLTRAFNAIDSSARSSAATSNIISSLSRENEASLFFSLLMQTPLPDALESQILTPSVTLTELKYHKPLPLDAEAFIARVRNILSHHLHSILSDEVWYSNFSPSGRFLATGSLDGTCNIYDVQNGFSLLAELDANAEDQESAFVSGSHKPALDKKKGIIYFCWEPHERYIVTCCLDTVIRVWRVENITQSKRITRSMDDTKLTSLVSCFTLGERMRTWPCEFLPYKKNATPHFIVGSRIRFLKVFTVDGTELVCDSDPDVPASSGNDHTSGTNVDDSKSSAASSQQFKRINDFAITANGKVLITANNDKQVFFYRIPDLFDPAATTSQIASLSLNGRLTSCTVSANDRYMLLSIAPEELQLWDISPLERYEKPFLKQKFVGQSQATYMVRSYFGYLNVPENKEELILSGSDDGYIYIWKLGNGPAL